MTENELAPIILFVYNRPWHTQQTIQALEKNALALESELYIYSDGPKNEFAIESVTKVRNYIKTIEGFNHINIIERENNWGLSNSIIDGVTKTLSKHKRVIVLEDDILTSPYFLRYMNEALEFYNNEEKVMHISGYIPPINTNGLPETFFLKPTSCWGWATWNRAWKNFEKDTDKLLKIFTKKMIKEFNVDNSMDYFSHIILNKKGELETWAIYWYATVFVHGGLSLHPKFSFVKNIGLDGSGIHCEKSNIFDVEFSNSYDIKFEPKIEESLSAKKAMANYYHSLKNPLWRKIYSKLTRTLR